jgi:predicted dehydrogenase
MRAVIVGHGQHTRYRVESLRAFTETTFLEPGEDLAARIADHPAGIVVIDDAGRYAVAVASQAIRNGKHVLVGFPRAQSVTEFRNLGRLAEEAGVRVGVSSVHRMLPSIRTLRRHRPRLVSVHTTVADGDEFLTRLVDWLDTCLSFTDHRDVQKVDAEAIRTVGGAIVALGVSIRFQNGTLALLYQDRGPGSATISVGGDDGVDRVSLTRHGIEEETAAAVRYETHLFASAVFDGREPPVTVATVVRTLRLTEHVMTRLRRRAVVTI